MQDKIKVAVKGLTCANCAAKIEQDILKLHGIESANVNLIKQELVLKAESFNSELQKDIVKIVKKREPEVLVSFPASPDCSCNSQNHFHEFAPVSENRLVWKVKGLTCANCSAKIETDLEKLEFISSAHINLIKQELTIEPKQSGTEQKIDTKVKQIVHRHEPDVEVFPVSNQKQEEIEEPNAFQKKALPFGIGIALFLVAECIPMPETVRIVTFLISYLIFGLQVLITAAKNISRGQVFDENFLMSLSTLGAIAIGELPEAVFVMLFYQVGETFQDFAVHRSRRSIKNLMDIRPDYANLDQDGEIHIVSPGQIRIGNIIVVKPGERIPLDGIVTDGNALLDTSALTGESVPRKVSIGQEVLSGSINTNGILKIKVTKLFQESTASKIIELVENAGNKKSKTEQFITRFSKIYTPFVVIAAIALAFLPPLLGYGEFSMWLGRALIFLVVSCPCALVLSVPLGFFSGIGEASSRGVLVKGSNYIQALNEVDTVVFDKTGTLTKGAFEVSKIVCAPGWKEADLIKWVSAAEKPSNHPIAKSITQYYEAKNKPFLESDITSYEEISGHGVFAMVQGHEIYAGNQKLMKRQKINFEPYNGIGSVVYTIVDGQYAGYIVVSDQLKKDSKSTIQILKQLGVTKTVMLTGDNKTTAEKIQQELDIDFCFAELLPHQKVEKLEELLKTKQKGKIAFVGDGINDAPVLARADVGIAMGAMGSDAAIEAADIVIMNDEPVRITEGIRIARRTNQIVTQNIIFALGVKAIVLVLGAMGIASMWMAVFADVGVAFLAILNSMRKKIK